MADRAAKRGAGRPKDRAKAEAILNAGWALFLERGVGAVSIEAIAARAGVSKMTVYGHFPDKHALFEAAVARETRAIEAAQALPADPDAGADLRDRLRAFGMGPMTFLESAPALDYHDVLAGEVRRRPALARTFYDAGPGRTLANLSALLAAAGDELAIDDPARAAEALFGLWQGAGNYRVGLEPDPALPSVAERVEYGVDLFLRAYHPSG